MALFDEFEEYETAESKFAHSMDNLQPLLLNNSNNGDDWKEHDVNSKQVYNRQSKVFCATDYMCNRYSKWSGRISSVL